jgi:sugar/nucleoside kinase (ribokinase family)
MLPGRLGGGAANIASALVLAGHEVLVVGRVGQDAPGQYVLFALHARGLSLDGVRVDAAPTASVQILIEPTGERTIVWIGLTDGIEPWFISPELVRRFLPDVLVLRGSVPAIPSESGLLDNRLVIAHMPWKGERPERVDIAIGSSDDLGTDALENPFDAASDVFGAVRWGVVTAGAGGVRAGSKHRMLAASAIPAEVIDSTGAGDLFIAGLADALVANAFMEQALAHGCRWGAASVGIEGSAPEPNTPGFSPFIHESDACGYVQKSRQES